MDDVLFEHLTRSVAAARTRRSLLRLLGGGIAAGLFGGGVSTDAKRRKKKRRKKRRLIRDAFGCTNRDDTCAGASDVPCPGDPARFCFVTIANTPFCAFGGRCFAA